jgi:branched-chain amino acid transport system substrate-binding protein
VVYINNDYGIGVKDTFVSAFEQAGGKVLIAQPIELGGKDFRTEVLKVKAANPKVVFIVDHVAEGSIVLKQAKELGMEAQWVTDVSMVAKEVVDLAGGAAEGVMGRRAGSTQTPEYKAFNDAFVKKFNEEPTIWSDFAYDTMMLVAKAIEKGGYNADAIQKALFEVADSYVGPSGAKKFDQYGISQGSYEWMTVKDGQWQVYEKKYKRCNAPGSALHRPHRIPSQSRPVDQRLTPAPARWPSACMVCSALVHQPRTDQWLVGLHHVRLAVSCSTCRWWRGVASCS